MYNKGPWRVMSEKVRILFKKNVRKIKIENVREDYKKGSVTM